MFMIIAFPHYYLFHLKELNWRSIAIRIDIALSGTHPRFINELLMKIWKHWFHKDKYTYVHMNTYRYIYVALWWVYRVIYFESIAEQFSFLIALFYSPSVREWRNEEAITSVQTDSAKKFSGVVALFSLVGKCFFPRQITFQKPFDFECASCFTFFVNNSILFQVLSFRNLGILLIDFYLFFEPYTITNLA